jgi:alginate O-acetyltransferase complex protein AlgI
MVVADNLAPIANQIFSSPDAPSGAMVLIATYAFAFQIYCDFSGYTDIARGVAKLLGIELMLNFNQPYLAVNPSDFWRRWHISLSTWLRDYLYIPLGGNRGGRLLNFRNLMLTMVLGGLWHGAAWNFVLWGFYHGALLVGHRYLTDNGWTFTSDTVAGRLVSRVIMFHAVCYGWLLFRASSVSQIWSFSAALVRGPWVGSGVAEFAGVVILLVALLWAIEAWVRNEDDPAVSAGWNHGMGAAACGVLLVLLIVLSAPAGQSFIYFQF